MSSREEASTDGALGQRALEARETFARSTGLKVAAVGLVFYALAVVIRFGVWAAIFGFWGATLMAVGLLSFVVVWWRR